MEGSREEPVTTRGQHAGVAMLLAGAAPSQHPPGLLGVPHAWAGAAFGRAGGCMQQSGGARGRGGVLSAQ